MLRCNTQRHNAHTAAENTSTSSTRHCCSAMTCLRAPKSVWHEVLACEPRNRCNWDYKLFQGQSMENVDFHPPSLILLSLLACIAALVESWPVGRNQFPWHPTPQSGCGVRYPRPSGLSDSTCRHWMIRHHCIWNLQHCVNILIHLRVVSELV